KPLAAHQGPMYALFETEFNVRMVRADEKIRALAADAASAALLDVPEHTPLLNVERIAYTYNDVPMEFRRGLYRTDSHHYHNTLN
ncbi:MAG: UTRA domain-containing protein, partial [Haliea sp.]